jgi:sulfite reductase (ferredoxin)
MATIPVSPKPEIANEVLRLHAEAVLFLAGELAPHKFRGQRVYQGIYEQRRRGSYLLRVRLPAGMVRTDQLRGLAQLALENGVSRLHVTSRQDLQFHDLRLESSLRVQGGLLALGLTSYGSGGDSVRNIVADPLSGLLPGEACDVRPYTLALEARYLGPGKHPSLPRKVKIAFSASDADRAGASFADLGFVAQRRAGAIGFRVFVAGGLGHMAAIGLELSPWVPPSDVFGIVDGLLVLFSIHGDRVNRREARLRHLRRRLGDDAFLQLCRESIANTEQRLAMVPNIDAEIPAEDLPTLPAPLPAGNRSHAGIVPEREQGRFSLRLRTVHGDVTPSALLALVDIAADFCSTTVRVGLEQELWLTGIGGDAIVPLLARLRGLGLGTPDERVQSVVACSGASTCLIGQLQARAAAVAIEQRLDRAGLTWNREPIRISGCPNACCRHLVAELGLEGRSVRVGNRQMPTYAVHLGGAHGAGNARIGVNAGIVSARRVPELIAAICRLDQESPMSAEVWQGYVRALVERFAQWPAEIPEEWFLDWGNDGTGESGWMARSVCAAAM